MLTTNQRFAFFYFMTIREIKKLPNTFDDRFKGESDESVLRAYQILEKVKEMLGRGDSSQTVLEIIMECETHDAPKSIDTIVNKNVQYGYKNFRTCLINDNGIWRGKFHAKGGVVEFLGIDYGAAVVQFETLVDDYLFRTNFRPI